MNTITAPQTQITPLPKLSITTFLHNKKLTPDTCRDSINSLDTAPSESTNTLRLPSFSFAITGYSIGEHVEYQVQLREEVRVLGRKVARVYKFSTRYSKLERLDEKLGGMGLPDKKWVGNKRVEFVQKRKKELEAYLNRIAACRNLHFYKFVKQIKDCDFNRGLKQKFTIE